MSAVENFIGYQWLYDQLGSDTTLLSYAPGGLFRAVAPDLTPSPYSLMSFQSGANLLTFNGVRVWSAMSFQVKAVGKASQSSGVFRAAKRIDDLLGGSQGKRMSSTASSLINGLIYSCVCESPIQYDDDESGVQYMHLGGMYRLTLQQA